jgi:hypothetical protein
MSTDFLAGIIQLLMAIPTAPDCQNLHQAECFVEQCEKKQRSATVGSIHGKAFQGLFVLLIEREGKKVPSRYRSFNHLEEGNM